MLSIILFLNINVFAFGQKPLVQYDLRTGIFDTLNITPVDTNKESEFTNYFIGSFDTRKSQLRDEPPTTNIYENSQFSLKEKVKLAFDQNNFPIRTSLKVFLVEDDSLIHNCTASMISTRHALTAAHCLVYSQNPISFDSILVCPVYNYGEFNENFSCSYVNTVYFFEDYSVADGEDFLILELKDEIGIQTGWIGIGYHQNDSFLEEQIFYRFSYPSVSIPLFDENEYNGDTLYFNYGIADLVEEDFIGITNASGIPGESGASLINSVNFSTYGVSTFASNLRHSRLVNWTFYAIKNVIDDSFDPVLNTNKINESLEIFPNPASDVLHIKSDHLIQHIRITNVSGQFYKTYIPKATDFTITLDKWSSGIYFIQVMSQNETVEKKIIVR